MNFVCSFLFHQIELIHKTNSNFVYFSISLETLLSKQQPNKELVLEWHVAIKYSPTERKLYGQLYKSRCRPLLVRQPSHSSHHPIKTKRLPKGYKNAPIGYV